MKPAEAAAVFARLDDARVANILSHLGARQAGSILGKLPRDRAARLSEVLLKPVRSGS
jgi:flagellar motility protein MotE (MotC chaperone)